MASTQAIIIEEVSIMSGKLLEQIDEICGQTPQGSLKMKPFGGKHVILFGDLLQLPEVVKFMKGLFLKILSPFSGSKLSTEKRC